MTLKKLLTVIRMQLRGAMLLSNF